MKNIFTKLISLLLIATMLTTTVFAEMPEKTGKNVYVDGVKYSVDIDNEFNIIVETVDSQNRAKMIIDKNGIGTVTGVSEQKRGEEYQVIINELNKENVDVEVKSKDGRENIEKITKRDVISSDYTGQAVAAGVIVVTGTLLKALIAALGAVTILGVMCYSVEQIADKVKDKKNHYYKAHLKYNTVFINPNAITKASAVSRVKGGNDVYTYTNSMAKDVVVSTKLGYIGPENHWASWKAGSFFDHYHTKNRNGAHSFYGLPRTRSL